jgi:hypothetical protein
MSNLVLNETNIKNMIFTIRDKQVMIDKDLAVLYGVSTKALNQAVKRNIDRFPDDFRFQLTDEEKNELVTKCDRFKTLKHSSSNPYAFTEQGISMLSAVLKSKIAIEVSIKIIRAFVEMRKFLLSNASIFQRLDKIEYKLLKHDEKFEKVFEALETKKVEYNQGVFFEGQIWDAYEFVNNLLKRAKNKVILIDNYIDDSILTIFSKYPNLKFEIITKSINKQLKLDIEKYNAQYKNLQVKISSKYHDRFLIVDNTTYHIGASLKDLGKKVFAFSKLNINVLGKYYEKGS